MAICSYLVIPRRGEAAALGERLAALPGCEVVRAKSHELLLLVTESTGPQEEDALRGALERTEGVHALVLTFGEIRPQDPHENPLPGSVP